MPLGPIYIINVRFEWAHLPDNLLLVIVYGNQLKLPNIV